MIFSVLIIPGIGHQASPDSYRPNPLGDMPCTALMPPKSQNEIEFLIK